MSVYSLGIAIFNLHLPNFKLMVGCASAGEVAVVGIGMATFGIKRVVITDNSLEKNEKIRLCVTISVE